MIENKRKKNKTQLSSLSGRLEQFSEARVALEGASVFSVLSHMSAS